MSSKGNALENVYNSITTASDQIINTASFGTIDAEEIRGNIEGETKPFYDEITGENARKKKAAEQKAERATKKAISEQKKKTQQRDKLEGERTQAAKQRSAASSQQSKKGKTGRRSTILTDNLGSLGGEENQGKKSLLGY